METVYIVYKTDNWHSYASFDLLAVATSKEQAIKLVKQQAKIEGEKISKDDLFNLSNIKQTQGYKGDGEFYLQETELNELQ